MSVISVYCWWLVRGSEGWVARYAVARGSLGYAVLLCLYVGFNGLVGRMTRIPCFWLLVSVVSMLCPSVVRMVTSVSALGLALCRAARLPLTTSRVTFFFNFSLC